LSVCVAAGEAGGSIITCRRFPRMKPAPDEGNGVDGVPLDGPAVLLTDPAVVAETATKRAKGQVRRFCAVNRLNRLGTLTYAGSGCHDEQDLRDDVAGFWRALREAMGGTAFPYLWVAEWHPKGHGLHVHFAVGQFVARSKIEAAWGRGFVHIKLLGDLPVGSGPLQEARVAAGYLSKYLNKSLDERRTDRLHRYEVAQGFLPVKTSVSGRTLHEAIRNASALMGGHRPAQLWESGSVEGWDRPPAVWMSWD
jgi:hypothetical protein